MSSLAATSAPEKQLLTLDKGIDFWLLGAAGSLLMIGLIMISSASIDIADVRNDNPFFYVMRHGTFLIVGLVAGFAVVNVPVAWWMKSGWLLLFVSLALLVLVLLPGVGRTVNGSTRWIGFGGLNLQVSELAKLFLIAYMASYLDRRREEVMASWWGFVKPMLVMFMAAFLLLMEPDFGATVVIASAVLGMIFLSGARIGQFSVLIVGCSITAVLLVMSQPYRLKRFTGYTDPWADQFGSGYQLSQALIAFGRGEWTGLGLGNSIQKLFYLPEAHTDFVFAILAEEFGLLGCFVVIGLFSLLVFRALKIGIKAEKANQRFAAYFAYGIGLLIGGQALINMGVNTGLLPTKGLTLPLVSYGGSSLVVSCMCIGVLVRINLERCQFIADDSKTAAGGKGG
ncbi:putative lipid II flippase FtsW [Alkalimarinus alittae]|uniref:Probable peptidoglycan glycosyltransferase FtsW n=1 Tax=Alkalimarinus alittae TaxID=2961619 RepID=A0ABY6N0K1_9ALTE|nr:putative lipid II flippase FtsW [Alkalimarinus alittae]UZE95560.1 putative lipid II flippase FtsW [Alkalimarinus alittae]